MSSTVSSEQRKPTEAPSASAQPGEAFYLTPPPHVRRGFSTTTRQLLLCAALIPVYAAAVFFFGAAPVVHAGVAVVTALVVEAVVRLLRKRSLRAPWDAGSPLTALLLVATLPPHAPIWMTMIGVLVAIGIGREIFGGTGHTIFHPALVGRGFLAASYGGVFRAGTTPATPFPGLGGRGVAGVTGATPLRAMAEGSEVPLENLFVGQVQGAMGETSVVAILIAAAFVFALRLVRWEAFVAYVVGIVVLAAATSPFAEFAATPFAHLFAGGAMLAAVFFVTDSETTPVTRGGRIAFGLGAAALTLLIRIGAGSVEGAMYAILLMSAIGPLITRAARPQPERAWARIAQRRFES